jgi:O-antigen/teichoic acid export membrane protein
VQHPRGEEPAFIETAWTLQVLRGVLQWLLVCALAWPLALMYEEPKLLWLLPICARSLPIQSLGSMAPVILHRRVRNGPVVLLDLQSQVAGMVCIVAWALVDPSIRALVAGMLVSAIVRTLLSYRLLPEIASKLHWNREYAHDLIRFGRWIIIATAMTFLMNQGDRIVLGKILDARQLGIYSVAFFLSSAV